MAEITARERRTRDRRTEGLEEAPSPLEADLDKRQNPASPAVARTAQGRQVGDRTGPPYVSPTVGTSFLAVQLGSESLSLPPDTMGAVGPTQILVDVNGRLKLFDKLGAPAPSGTPFNVSALSFWASVRNGQGVSDPHVEYDRFSQRWFLVIINVPATGPNRVLIAVSSGDTITNTSSFTFFQFQQDFAAVNADTDRFADYPTLGVDKFALYIGANMFNQALTAFQDTTAFVVDKADLLASTLTVTAFRDLISPTGGPYTPQGVTNQDPDATEGYFIGVDSNVFGELVIRRVTDPGGTPTLSSDIDVPVPSTTSPQPVQPPSGPTLDAIDDRLFAASIMQHPSTGELRLWTAHNIEVNSAGVASSTGNRDGSRWYEIGNLATSTPDLMQSGTLFDSAASNPLNYWIPSIAASGQGHAIIGTSRAGPSSPSGFPGVAVAERLFTDPLGTLGPPALAQSSSFTYDTSFPGTERWGDYSQTVVDPTDNMTFWTFQEYVSATNTWGVRVIELRAPPPATPVPTLPATVAPSDPTEVVVITGTSTNGSGFFDPGPDTGGPGFANDISVSVNGGATVNGFTVTDPTHITLDVDTTAASTGPKTVTITNPDSQVTNGTVFSVCSGDSTDPDPFGLTSPADGATITTATPTFAWQASSDSGCGLAKYQLFIDGVLNVDNVSPGTTSSTPAAPLSAASHSWQVKAFDFAGNEMSSPVQSFTVDACAFDATPPAPFGLTSPADGASITTASPTFAWQASSDSGCGLAKYQLFIDGVLNVDNITPGATSATSGSPLSEGAHSWRVRAFDGTGNIADSGQRTLTVDLPGVHPRSVTLTLKKHLKAKGTVSVLDGFAPCIQAAPVEIERKAKGGWKTIKSIVTDAVGVFSTNLPDRDAKYRGQALETALGADICAADTSPRQRHRHSA